MSRLADRPTRLEAEALRDLVAHSVDLAAWRVSDAGVDVPFAAALESLARKVWVAVEPCGDAYTGRPEITCVLPQGHGGAHETSTLPEGFAVKWFRTHEGPAPDEILRARARR